MKVFKSIVNTIINILIVLVLVVSVLVATLALTSKSSGISSVFGYTVQPIMSYSMEGGSDEYEGGDFTKGDIIIGKTTNFDENATYEVGDIVTFKDVEDDLICHRIIEIVEENGQTLYRTKGDNNVDADLTYIASNNIGAVFYTDDYHGKVIHGVGNVYEFISTQKGFFLCILLPMIIFFLYVLVKVVIDAVNYKNAKKEEEREKNADSKTSQMSDEEYEEFKAFMASKKAEQEDDSAQE